MSAKKIYAIVEGRKMHEIYETKIIFEYMKKKHTFVLIMSVKAKGGGLKAMSAKNVIFLLGGSPKIFLTNLNGMCFLISL